MAKRKFTVFLMPDHEGVYRAFSPYYPGCITDGDTVEEALEHVKEAMEGILEAEATDSGDPVPSYVHACHVVVGEVEIEVPEILIEAKLEKKARRNGPPGAEG